MKTTTSRPRARILIATAAFSAVAASLATLCAAAGPTNAPTATVNYADLNISTPYGASELYGRIRHAAQAACSPLDGRDLASQRRKAACIQRAIADAVSNVDEPALFTVYNAQNPATPSHLLSQRR